MTFVGIVFFACVFATTFLLVINLLPDKEVQKAQAILNVQEKREEYKYLLLKYTFPLYTRLIPFVSQFRLPKLRERIKYKIVAGAFQNLLSVDQFFALKVATFIYGFAAKLLFIFGMGDPFSVGDIALWSIIGFFVPDIWLSMAISKREKAILRELPFFIDLLTLSIEAGLDFIAAITRIAEKQKGTILAAEFSAMLSEIKLGTSRADSLKHLASRIKIPEVSSFLAILIQATQMGISMGTVLRTQSEVLREQRFQKAEKLGAQATQKMLIPLIFFILPSLLVVIFGPIALDFVYGNQ